LLVAEDEDFSYIPGADNGPENWGKIKPEWANCSVGRMQSPIDLSDERAKLVQSLGYLNTSYRPAEATIVNTGHSVMVRDLLRSGHLTGRPAASR
jgi:carbonic anhydrase